jgi:SAM-dependent methyltransferase
MQYSDAALQKVREDRLLINRVDEWLFEEISPYMGQRVLEIGCGMGNFARYMIDRELYIGIDTSITSIGYVREKFSDNENLSFMAADVTEDEFVELKRYEANTVFSLNVFEHVPDHKQAMRNVHRTLNDNGVFILVVPAHEWLYGTIDRAIGHYRRYSKDSLIPLLEEVGFTCVLAKYINVAGALGWFLNGRIFKKETPPSGQLRYFNLVVPALKGIERAFTMPFGISLIVVCSKK